jgi:hypothetical protein
MKGLVYLACCVAILGMMGCGTSQQQGQQKQQEPKKQKPQGHYLKYNLHYYTRSNNPQKFASVVNYIRSSGHGFYPYGTLVKTGTDRRGYKFIVQETKDVVYVECRDSYIANKNRSEYLGVLVSDTPVSYTGLSDVDQKGISEGEPYEGMSKKGIMIALGYPVPSLTPSPDADEWYYWNNRFSKCIIHFKDGKVDKIN